MPHVSCTFPPTCRPVLRAGQRTQLCLATPLLGEQGSQQPDTMLLQQLPFMDDTRAADMPSFDRRVPTHQKQV